MLRETMADETPGAPAPQAGTGAQLQASTSQPQAGNAQSSQADGAENADGTVDVTTLQRELSEARREAARTRTDLNKLRDAAKAADEAKLPEQERLQRRIAELEQATAAHERERSEWSIRDAVGRAAVRVGFRDPVDAFALLDRDQLDLDEKGLPKNVDRLLADLLAAKPYLGGTQPPTRPQGSADGGLRGPAPAQTDMNAALRAAAGRGPR